MENKKIASEAKSPSGVDPRHDGIAHQGSEKLAEKYNIDEQALLDSSEADFTKTTSKFHHADGSTPPKAGRS